MFSIVSLGIDLLSAPAMQEKAYNAYLIISGAV